MMIPSSNNNNNKSDKESRVEIEVRKEANQSISTRTSN